MEPNEHDELTPAERRALDALPRERRPGRLLEERTVRALRERGFLRPVAARRFPAPAWLAGGIAAALALFAGGFVAGQRSAAGGDAGFVTEAPVGDATESALAVQRAGSEYVAALGLLVESTASADARQTAQAREVALAALWAAAGEVVRLAPDDPIAGEILRGFERTRQEQQPAGPERVPVRQVIWF